MGLLIMQCTIYSLTALINPGITSSSSNPLPDEEYMPTKYIYLIKFLFNFHYYISNIYYKKKKKSYCKKCRVL